MVKTHNGVLVTDTWEMILVEHIKQVDEAFRLSFDQGPSHKNVGRLGAPNCLEVDFT